MGTPREGGPSCTPVILTRPVSIPERVLHIEQPHTDGSSDHHKRQLDQRHGVPPQRESARRYRDSQHQIVEQHTSPFPLPGERQVVRKPMLYDELICWPQTQQNWHAAIPAVAQAAPTRAGAKLFHGQCSHVPELSAIQIPRSAMMHSMSSPPIAEREQCDQPEAGPNPTVGPRAGKERVMTAIVLDDE